jgi:hypothetical protein
MKSPCPIVVSSCDAYSDLWPVFFHCLFRHWPEAGPVYLISGTKRYADPRVETVALGHDRHWATNTLEALERIPGETCLYLQDDYLLTGPADPAALARLHALHVEQGAAATSLYNRAVSGTPIDGSGVVAADAANEWVFDFQAAFWDRRQIVPLIEPGATPWHSEGEMNEKARAVAAEGRFRVLTPAHPVVLPYLQGIRGGMWLPEARALCQGEKIAPDFRFRPCARFRAGFVNRFYRRYLKRRATAYRRRLGPGDELVRPFPGDLA